MSYHSLFYSFFFALTTLSSTGHAAFIVQDGKIHNADEKAIYAPQEHFQRGCKAMENKDWHEAAYQFNVIIYSFPGSSFEQDAYFFKGVADFEIEEYDFANCAFTDYLKGKNNPRYFQEAVEYKYAIAEQFRCGAKRRPFGTKQLPKCLSGVEMAVEIYDDVIAAVPSQELAAQALYSKGYLLWSLHEWRSAIEAFQSLIRRFPKYELTPDAYLNITRIYLDQSMYEFQNPDLLAFAELNTKKFRQEFPREELVEEAEQNVRMIKEVYAKGLYDTGRFYERTCKVNAAVIYYESTINKFPDTTVADCSRRRLAIICPDFLQQLESRPQAPAEQTEEKNEKEVKIDDFSTLES